MNHRSLYRTSLVWSIILAGGLHAEDELQPMFNGQDLTGWVRSNTPEETWSIRDGMLICTGKPIGEIRTEKMYENFIMELEWRHMVPKGNAGIFVWADDITSRGVPFHRGIEVQVLENAYGNTRSHTTHGDIFPIHGATMTPINGRGGSRAFPTEERSNPSPEWNHYRIECRNGEISLAVNGKVVTRGKDCVPRKGYICLESEGGVVHYRNVRIRELPPSEDLAVEHVAIANRGYQSLYSGLSLDGWGFGEGSEKWTSKDWVLAFEGENGETGQLICHSPLPQTGFVVDVRLKNEKSGAAIQFGDETVIDLRDSLIAPSLQPNGSWNRIEGISGDGGMQVLVNGTPAILTGSLPKQAALTLSASEAVDFCNIYGK